MEKTVLKRILAGLTAVAFLVTGIWNGNLFQAKTVKADEASLTISYEGWVTDNNADVIVSLNNIDFSNISKAEYYLNVNLNSLLSPNNNYTKFKIKKINYYHLM